MKKIVALFTIFVLLLSFSGCDSKKLTAKNLVGTWDAEITLEQFAGMTGEDLTDGYDDMSSEFDERLGNLSLTFRLVFKKDNTCDALILKSDFEKIIDDQIEILIDYWRKEGLIKLYQSQGVDVKTNEDVEALLISLDTNTEEVLATLKTQFEEIFDSADITKPWGKPDKNGYFTVNSEPEKFSVEENVITIINTDDNKEVMYCELTDKDTLVIDRMVVDYEEYKGTLIFKRVK